MLWDVTNTYETRDYNLMRPRPRPKKWSRDHAGVETLTSLESRRTRYCYSACYLVRTMSAAIHLTQHCRLTHSSPTSAHSNSHSTVPPSMRSRVTVNSPVSDIEHLGRQHIRAGTARHGTPMSTLVNNAVSGPSLVRTMSFSVCVVQCSTTSQWRHTVRQPRRHLSVQLLQARPTHDARQLRHTLYHNQLQHV